jgi:hypothetical protein
LAEIFFSLKLDTLLKVLIPLLLLKKFIKVHKKLKTILPILCVYLYYQSEIDYLNIKTLQIERITILCPKYHAKKWKDETHGLCCADGKDVLHQFEDLPYLIKSLIDNSHPLSKHSFDNYRRSRRSVSNDIVWSKRNS